jgi:hypothetical protein
MPAYLDDLRDLGYLVAQPDAGPTFTVEDDGSLVIEWQAPRLAVRLPAQVADNLAADLADARHREAEGFVDDAGLWPPTP